MSSYRNTSIRSDLKGIVDAFRVSELVTICTVAGLSRNGKKTELLSRIYNLIRDPVPQQVEKKIMELYRANNPNSAAVSMQQRGNMDMNGNRSATYGAPTQIPKPPTAPPRPTYGGGYNGKPPVAHIAPNNRGGGGLNSLAGGATGAGGVNNGPLKPMEQPDVRFKVIPFYDVIDVIFKPFGLTPHNINSTYQDAYFTFALSQHHLEQIQKSPMVNVYGTGGTVCDRSHQVQAQMRFCMMETSCEQLDCYPPYINVRINSKSVELPPVLPQSKAGQLPKRSPKPLNITKYIRFDNQINHVQIQWTTEYARSWVCAVFLVKENDSSALLQRLKQKGPRNTDHTRALIKDKLKIDPDSEIAMTTLRISLKCPLGVCRMTMPVRSKQCSHVQCFDATFYVRMNEKRPCWQCPVCNKEAPFADLQLDGYFLEVLDSSTYECTEIYCYDNGSWEPIDGDKTTVQTITGTGYAPVDDSKTSGQIVESEPLAPLKVEPRSTASNTTARVTRSSSISGSTVETSKKLEEKTKSSQVSVGKSSQVAAKKDSDTTPVSPDEVPENPPEIVDLCSDSDDDDTPTNANTQRPVSAISISSTSPGGGPPAVNTVNANSTSPFPSPPLIQPTRQDLSPFNIWGDAAASANSAQTGFIGDTRKRSHEQFSSMPEPHMALRHEEPLAKNMQSSTTASRSFLNPARSAQSMMHSNRSAVMHPSHNTGGPGYLYPPPPTNPNLMSGNSLDPHLLGMPPLISPYDQTLEGQKRIGGKTKGDMNIPMSHHRDPSSTIIPPPPKPPSAMVGSHANNPHVNNYFPPPPTRPVESSLNIIELE